MSRLKEALVFKTDEERLAWFQSISPEDQEEIVKELNEITDKVNEAFRPVTEALVEFFAIWFEQLRKNFQEIADNEKYDQNHTL